MKLKVVGWPEKVRFWLSDMMLDERLLIQIAQLDKASVPNDLRTRA